ncbi:hypothetical protein FRX31_018513 [Thalictrum thalictroides]|uniref:Uncharacterized protein n=1 Tax=Thalictrum thalictroides TaxID=46969 RepID=A0A7J6W5S3_THATH|nr:hypothetical protein FRX31_018513 [Thalictrum thalictroides]
MSRQLNLASTKSEPGGRIATTYFSLAPSDRLSTDLEVFYWAYNRFDQLLSRDSMKDEVLQNWAELNNRGLAAMVWTLLPVTILKKMVLQVKGLLWDWLKSLNIGQDAKKAHSFTDLAIG